MRVFNTASEVADCYRLATKQTQSNHEELPAEVQVTPKPVQFQTTDQYCFDFNPAIISRNHIQDRQ